MLSFVSTNIFFETTVSSANGLVNRVKSKIISTNLCDQWIIEIVVLSDNMLYA